MPQPSMKFESRSKKRWNESELRLEGPNSNVALIEMEKLGRARLEQAQSWLKAGSKIGASG